MVFLSTAVKVIIAVPKLLSMFELMIDLYREYQIGQLGNIRSNRKTRRKALLNAIRTARNNDERKELSILLQYHIIGRMPDDKQPIQ